MIRVANESDFIRDITTESELRICALKRAYGLDVPFIQFFADDMGCMASVMDGFCVVYSRHELNEEWRTFLRMHADIRIIHSNEEVIAKLADEMEAPYKKGEVMSLSNVSSECTLHKFDPQNVSLREIYAFLDTIFDDLTPFDGWYVDVSHRVRHGCCHIAIERDTHESNGLIGSAMTIAETDAAALIGGVATLPKYRGRGIATRCVSELLTLLPQKTVFIAPSNENSARVYAKLGFIPSGTWAEIVLR